MIRIKQEPLNEEKSNFEFFEFDNIVNTRPDPVDDSIELIGESQRPANRSSNGSSNGSSIDNPFDDSAITIVNKKRKTSSGVRKKCPHNRQRSQCKD